MRITIVGTGYVGLTTGVCLAKLGHEVICVDVVPERVRAISAGIAPFYEPGLEEMLSAALGSGRLSPTTELASSVASSEVTLITVGTPQSENGIDLSYISEAARQIGCALRRGEHYHVVAVKSTVVPGTTDTLVRSILEESSGLRVGEFGLCMNPEFLREGSAIDDFMNPDRIVIGRWDDQSGQVMASLYGSFDCPKLFTGLRNAEMIKYASNSLLATLISFSNEMAAICEATRGADARVVMDGVRLDRRLSPTVDGKRVSPGILSFLSAGCGFGGSCLPKDVDALRAYAKQSKVSSRLLDAVIATNADRPVRLASLAEDALGSLEGARVAVLGLAFKPGTDDLRESPALKLIDVLFDKHATVSAYDPIVTAGSNGAKLDGRVAICRTPGEALRDADAAVVVTAWPEFSELDWATLCRAMKRPIIVDGRNLLEAVTWPEGTTYLPIGRMHSDGFDDERHGTRAAGSS